MYIRETFHDGAFQSSSLAVSCPGLAPSAITPLALHLALISAQTTYISPHPTQSTTRSYQLNESAGSQKGPHAVGRGASIRRAARYLRDGVREAKVRASLLTMLNEVEWPNVGHFVSEAGGKRVVHLNRPRGRRRGACVRACVCVRVRACVRACVRVRACVGFSSRRTPNYLMMEESENSRCTPRTYERRRHLGPNDSNNQPQRENVRWFLVARLE